MSPLPRTDRRALRRSASRANAVANALGFVATQDPEIRTTFRLHAPDRADDVELWMGSPALFAGSFQRDKVVDWMKLRAKGPASLPAGVKVRPPARTVFEWRDGLPGESPTWVTPGGAEFVIENDAGAGIDLRALGEWIDSLPRGAWLVMMTSEEIELRASPPATDDAATCARRLVELVRPPTGSLVRSERAG